MTQDYSGILGYDPFAGTAAMTTEDWAADFANTYANAWANGSIENTLLYQNGGMDNSFWSSAGLGPLDPTDRGSGTASAMTWNQFYQLGLHMANNWNSLPPALQGGMSNPTGLPGAVPVLGEGDRARIAAATAQDDQQDWLSGENAADRANRLAIASMQEAGANQRAQLAADTQRYGIDVGAAVDREAIASNERVAALDRASREAIANMQEAGLNRRFDLQLAEDRRQFNTGIMMGLLDRGIELSRRPVDWIAHQYFLANMQAPITALTLSSSAATFGAIPPSGPSAAGPVTGGPAAMDGDTTLATELGVRAGFTDIATAVQQLPGTQSFADAIPYTSPRTVEQSGGVQAVQQQLDAARETELPQALPDSPAVQETMRDMAFRRSRDFVLEGDANPNNLPVIGDQNMQARQQALQQSLAGQTMENRTPPPPEMQAAIQAAQSAGQTLQGAAPTGAFGATMTDALQGLRERYGAMWDRFAPEQRTAPAPGTTPTSDAPAQQTPSTGGESRGVYTGVPATPPTGQQATGAQSQQGFDLLQSIANELGMSLEQIQQLVPPHLLAGGYSRETIMNSPVIQSLVNGTRLSAFRTDPVGDSQFGQIQAFGIPLGLRGGQDVNARNFLTALPSQREQMQGAIEATGQYFPDVMEQMLRSSPTSNYDVGAFGRRRF